MDTTITNPIVIQIEPDRFLENIMVKQYHVTGEVNTVDIAFGKQYKRRSYHFMGFEMCQPDA